MSKASKANKLTKVATAAPIADEAALSEQRALQTESIRWLLTIVCSLLVYAVVALVVKQVYHPDTNVLVAKAAKLLMDTGSVRPEPVESLLFRLGIVVIIPSLFGFYSLFSGTSLAEKLSVKQHFEPISVLCILAMAALIWCDLAALNPYGPEGGESRAQNARDIEGVTNFDFYFKGIFIGSYLPVYCLIIVPLVAVLFLVGFKKYRWYEQKKTILITNVLGYGIAIWSVVAIVVMNTYEFPYSNENKFDFNAVYYSMTQVYAGVPLLVDRFVNTYGLYPHFLNPIFQLTGLSVFKFSLVMSLLLGSCFVLNFYVLKRFVANRVILFLGFTTVVFFPYLNFKVLTIFDSVFSLFPIRYIIPSVLLFLAMGYFARRSRWLYWLITAVMAAFILWNPEMGLVGYLAWVAANVYTDFYNTQGKLALKPMAFHLLSAVGMAAVAFYLYKLVIYLCYGSWPDLQLLFDPILFFGQFGVNNLPMAFIHPWNLSVLTIVCGFTYSLVRLYKKDITVKASFVFLLSMVALGYFAYFQGRSQNSNFSLSSSFSLMLLAILGDELWAIVRRANVLLANAVFVVFLFLVSFSFVEIVFNTQKIAELMYQQDDKEQQDMEQSRLQQNKQFVLSKSKQGEHIFIFQPKKRQGLYFGEGKRVSAFNPGFIDLFLRSDVERLEQSLRDSSYNVFIEPLTGVYDFLTRPLAAFASNYEFNSYNSMIGMFSKRQNHIPVNTFFANNKGMLVHHKYGDDTAGKNLRIADAQGLPPVSPGPQYSVSSLFFTSYQVFQIATVAGNITETGGFMISNILGTYSYNFGVGSTGSALALPQNTWCYCVMNIYPDHFDVFCNGKMIHKELLPQPAAQSSDQVYLGNIAGYHYFIGAIAEVAIANRIISDDEQLLTWQKIDSEVNHN